MGKRKRRKNRSGRPLNAGGGSPAERQSPPEDPALRLESQAIDPAVPPERVADSLLAYYEGEHVPGELAFEIVREASAERARDIARAALELEPTSLPALTLAGAVAEALKEADACVGYYRKAVEISPDPMTHWCYVVALQAADRNADALEELERLSRLDPAEWAADPLYRDSYVEALRRQTLFSDADACPCGDGRSYDDCCRPRELAALDRFLDRSPFDALRRAILQYEPEAEDLEPVLAEARSRWFMEDVDRERDEGEARLFAEWAWTCARLGEDEDDEEEPGDSVLRLFLEDPATPGPLRRQARQWIRGVRWGLWLIKDPTPDPGVRVIDLLTGSTLYASIPHEQIDGLVPWTAILGALVPVEGVWRTGAAFYPMSPSTADHLASVILGLAGGVAKQVAGSKRASRLDPYGGLPATVVAEQMGQADELVCHFVSHMVDLALPELLGLLHEWAREVPALRNMDSHPLLLIKADIAVADPASLQRHLQDHPDFRMHEDEIVWMGRPMTPGEAEASLAGIKAMARTEGIDAEDLDPSNRWTLGTVELKGSVLTLDTNSEERLEAFLEVLGGFGAEPEMVARTAVDPRAELARRAADPSELSMPADVEGWGMSKAGLDAWARTWPDEAVPALAGMTPRRAAQHAQGHILLEALLRDLEHRAAANLRRGVVDVDVAELRAVLGMSEGHRPHVSATSPV